MSNWVRFEQGDTVGFGDLRGTDIAVHEGDMFNAPTATGDTLALDAVTLLTPCEPGKLIAIWNNSKTLAEKLGLSAPETPLFLQKPANTFLAPGAVIKKPSSYDGRVVYEGELAIVIGKTCKDISEADAGDYILGYTCLNDVTAPQLIDADPNFQQWVRAKGFDTFCPFGPGIVTDVNPDALTVKTLLNGRERQNYAVADMFFGPHALVSGLSATMTLEAGDVIACGTGVGVLPMKPGSTVDVVIDGVGTLSNPYEA